MKYYDYLYNFQIISSFEVSFNVLQYTTNDSERFHVNYSETDRLICILLHWYASMK